MYTTLARTKDIMKASSTTDDSNLLREIRKASRRVDRHFHSARPFFNPYIETRDFEICAKDVITGQGLFLLRENLLSLTSVTAGNESLAVDSVVETFPRNTSPIRKLHLIDTSTTWYGFDVTNERPLYLKVTGIWGYHSDYANAWLSVDTVQDVGGINASVTSVTVSDVDAADAYGETAISAGNLIRIDSEFMEVTATNTSTNVVTVRRGVNGSTAAAHDNGATVETWQVEDTVAGAVARQAAFQYARQGTYSNQQAVGDLGAVITFPADTLREFNHILQEYAYE